MGYSPIMHHQQKLKLANQLILPFKEGNSIGVEIYQYLPFIDLSINTINLSDVATIFYKLWIIYQL